MTKQESELYENFLEVQKSLVEAGTPVDNRVMYYFVISWWRHPIKRWRQKRNLRYILQTTDEEAQE